MEITVLGTNAVATTVIMKAGAEKGESVEDLVQKIKEMMTNV